MLYIDALQSSNWDREVLEEIRKGGIGAVHVTCALWESARDTLTTLGRWHRRIRDNSDIVSLAFTAADIKHAAETGRTAIVLGLQGSSPIEDELDLVEVFYLLGVRVMQLTYNNQSLIGGSCYEEHDSGLSRFGRQVIAQMNRVGMLVDLSHVGERTSLEAIAVSERPVTITHSNPLSSFWHARNKSDLVLKELAANGGVLGCTIYPPLIGGEKVTLMSWIEIVARAVDLIGIEHVGIGTDASRKWEDHHLQWVRLGRWAHDPSLGRTVSGSDSWPIWPAWFQTPADFPNIVDGLRKHGFSEPEMAAILGGNWMRIFSNGFGPQISAA